ncbi:MAG: PaaI family thioesterase [Burkholderiaceae bacterium]
MLRSDVSLESMLQFQTGTLGEHYGLQLTHLAQGQLHGQIEVQPWMMAPNGFFHAASVIALADTCAGYATVAHLPEGAKTFTTIELKTNFFSSTRSGLVRCEAHAEHLGRTTQGKKMALFRCTQMVLW